MRLGTEVKFTGGPEKTGVRTSTAIRTAIRRSNQRKYSYRLFPHSSFLQAPVLWHSRKVHALTDHGFAPHSQLSRTPRAAAVKPKVATASGTPPVTSLGKLQVPSFARLNRVVSLKSLVLAAQRTSDKLVQAEPHTNIARLQAVFSDVKDSGARRASGENASTSRVQPRIMQA